MLLVSTTRYCPDDFFNCPYQNAFWEGTQMVYGDGFASADDVVAHEMTHGVTEHESNLIYLNQSGAINESFSDIWGEFVDLTNGKGNDDPSVRWKVGEDLPPEIGAIRDMRDPTVFGDPDRMLSPNYWQFQCDSGGVHINSGIGYMAAYLMTDGGSFNGKTVTGIGITKVAKIFYEAQTNLLTTASDYNDLAVALQQACINLTGTDGITAADCQEVANAIIATEMDQTPPTNVLKNPGFESGRLYWTEYSSPLYQIITQDPSLAACYSNWYAGLGGDDNLTQYIYQDVTIPSNATQAQLRFAYFIFTTEMDAGIYDTMNVEIRRPNDNTLLTTLVTLSNLDDTAFYYYLSDKYDLLPYKGQTIRLRFYTETDYALPTFFVVDDVVLAVLTDTAPIDISLQSPADASVFDSCSLISNYQPSFQWTANTPFNKYTILISSSPTDFTTTGVLINKASVSGTYTTWKPSSFVWKKILQASWNTGTIRDIYWKVVGTKSDGTFVETTPRSLRIGDPQPVTINTPGDGDTLFATIPPTFIFDTNCNKKFTLQFSPLIDFSDSTKIKAVTITITNPNVQTTIQKTLSSFQWSGIVKLLGTGGYFRIKAWDALNRLTIEGPRAFDIQ
jgi:hypothetical protein